MILFASEISRQEVPDGDHIFISISKEIHGLRWTPSNFKYASILIKVSTCKTSLGRKIMINTSQMTSWKPEQ